MIVMERLNKYLAHAGVGSRRKVEGLITAGRVMIDGRVVQELGTQVEPGQHVAVDGVPVPPRSMSTGWSTSPGYLCTNTTRPVGRGRSI